MYNWCVCVGNRVASRSVAAVALIQHPRSEFQLIEWLASVWPVEAIVPGLRKLRRQRFKWNGPIGLPVRAAHVTEFGGQRVQRLAPSRHRAGDRPGVREILTCEVLQCVRVGTCWASSTLTTTQNSTSDEVWFPVGLKCVPPRHSSLQLQHNQFAGAIPAGYSSFAPLQ